MNKGSKKPGELVSRVRQRQAARTKAAMAAAISDALYEETMAGIERLRGPQTGAILYMPEDESTHKRWWEFWR